jgi:hypothetical protein
MLSCTSFKIHEYTNNLPFTAEARIRCWVGPCGVCGGQSGTETGFSQRNSIFPCQFHSAGAPLNRRNRKKFIIIIIIIIIVVIVVVVILITELHNKPQGCGASVASAAGPFTAKKTYHCKWAENDITGIVTWTTGWKVRGSNPGSYKKFFSSPNVHTIPGAHTAS